MRRSMPWVERIKRPRFLEFESPNHVMGDTLAGQAMFGLPHTHPCPRRVRIAALTCHQVTH